MYKEIGSFNNKLPIREITQRLTNTAEITVNINLKDLNGVLKKVALLLNNVVPDYNTSTSKYTIEGCISDIHKTNMSISVNVVYHASAKMPFGIIYENIT